MCTAHLSPVVRSASLMEEEWHDQSSLLDEAFDALRRTGYGQLRTIDLQYDDGTLTLSGQVPSHFLKQVAQTAVKSVAGRLRINNELCVVSPR